MFSLALSNPCVQYKATKFGFGAHFNQATQNTTGALGTNMNVRKFSAEAAGRPYNVHPRGYNDYTDVPYWIFHEISSAMQVAHSCDAYAWIFEKYADYLTDTQIGYAF